LLGEGPSSPSTRSALGRSPRPDDALPPEPESNADAIAVLDERRVNLAQSRVRGVNQLDASCAHPRSSAATAALVGIRIVADTLMFDDISRELLRVLPNCASTR
jgi:hypothetical protein